MTVSNDTSHLYDGKTVRSGAPSRKKAAGKITSSTEIPKDAIPEVTIPSFVESLFGGPLVPKMKFLPAAKNVQNLQFASAGAMVVLAVLTYIVTPQVGTPWFALGDILDIPAIGTGAIYVNLYEANGATPTGSALTLVPNTPASGSHEEAGVYSAEIGLDTTLTSVIPVWYSGATEYHTGSAITVKSVSAKNDNVQNEYVTTVTNLKNSYTRNETARFRLFVREKDWSPTLYTKATSEVESTIIPEAYWKLTRVTDSLDVINYGTGSTNHTKMSYDYSGSYFDFDMSLLERDYAYELRFIYKIDGDYHEQPEVFKFRVD